MASYTDSDLFRLDEQLAKEGVAFHSRPLEAARAILKDQFVLGAPTHQAQIDEICAAYCRLIPECETTWPGAGNGLAASSDQVRKVQVPVVYGSLRGEIWTGLGFEDKQKWIKWCRQDANIAKRSMFAFADLYDLAYGIDERWVGSSIAVERWMRATENLADLSSRLADSGNPGEALLQPIGLTVELSLKGSLIHLGIPSSDLASKKYGHGFRALADKLVDLCPHRDDLLVLEVVDRLPHLVNSRYSVTGLNRLEIVELALGVQFVAASAVRRISSYDMAAQMEADFSRPSFFSKIV